MRQTCDLTGNEGVVHRKFSDIEVGAAQQAGPPSSGTITCGCSSIIAVGAFHSGDSGSATRARGLLAMTGHILVIWVVACYVADIGQHV
jgi:hypothetical protein